MSEARHLSKNHGPDICQAAGSGRPNGGPDRTVSATDGPLRHATRSTYAAGRIPYIVLRIDRTTAIFGPIGHMSGQGPGPRDQTYGRFRHVSGTGNQEIGQYLSGFQAGDQTHVNIRHMTNLYR